MTSWGRNSTRRSRRQSSMAFPHHTTQCYICTPLLTFFRHYHKAVWSERKYQQLLSSSSSSSSHPMAPATELNVDATGHARRQLSATFETMTTTRAAAVSTSTDAEVLQGCEATPPCRDLQSSSDSVFMDNSSSPSPQVTGVTSRPNPLTSHISRHNSSVSAPPPPDFQLTRKTSIPTHLPHPLELGVGPHSPMAVGHKSRTPSGKACLVH